MACIDVLLKYSAVGVHNCNIKINIIQKEKKSVPQKKDQRSLTFGVNLTQEGSVWQGRHHSGSDSGLLEEWVQWDFK